MQFSILIPTWNNRAYLQHCIDSIEKHSSFKHQIIVIVNEGADDTIKWLQQNKIEYIHHPKNVGICVGLNSVSKIIKKDYVVYLNDDMVVMPDWDLHLSNGIEDVGHNHFMLSGTMIEPQDTGNQCVLLGDYGSDLETYQEKELLEFNSTAKKEDWYGASWPPVLLPTALWEKVGGMSEEFSPGMYSDPDLSMKLWKQGVRYFKGIGKSRVYHFGSKSTRNLGKNIGRSIFIKKWGITSSYFYRNYLKMGEDWNEPLPDFKQNLTDKLLNRLKKVFA